MRWRCVFLIGLSLLVIASPVGATDLEARMAAELKAQGLQGAVWALVGPEGTVTGAAGPRDAATGAPMRPDDKVQVGSITKTLVALGVLRLVADGRVTLDTPVATVLPDVPLDNPWNDTHPVRLRHLLSHTSGMDDLRIWHFLSRRADPNAPLSNSLEGHSDMLEVRVRPGARSSYSNLGYHLAGMVIERLTGQRYEAWLNANLLTPLGMVDSTFDFVDQAGDPRLAMGHFEKGAAAPAPVMWLRPATQFTTTAADMARLGRFLMGDGWVEGALLIPIDLLRAMGQPTGTEAAEAGLTRGYALGLASRDRNGAIARCHSGAMAGYNALFCFYTEERKAFFMAVNADDEGANLAKLESLLTHALGLHLAVVPPAAAAPPDLNLWLGTYAPAPSRFATAAYVDRLTQTMTLSKAGTDAILSPFQGTAQRLAPMGGMLFRVENRMEATHVLYQTADGTRILSTGFSSWERVNPWTQGALWAGLLAGLAGLIWVLGSSIARMRQLIRQPADPLLPAFLAVLGLLLPISALAMGDYMALGDPSLAAWGLAVATAVLPLAAGTGIYLGLRAGPVGWRAHGDMLALLAVLQWTATLAWWGLLPLRLWV